MNQRQELIERYAAPESGSRWVNVDGMDVHYRLHQHEDESRPVLVLVHGILDSLHTWDEWVSDLKSDFSILVFDVPGFALTYPVTIKKYERYTYAYFLKELLHELGIEQKVLLAGNSLGGFISWSFSYCFPEKVLGFFVTSPAAYPLKVPPVPIIVANIPLLPIISNRVLNRTLYDKVARSIYFEPSLMSEDNLQRGFLFMKMKGASSLHNKVFKDMAYFLKGYPHEVSELKVPGKVLWGDTDRFIPLKQMDLWKRDNPSLDYEVIEECGHVPHLEKPRMSSEILRNYFLNLLKD
jgi:pimeloyl-ACP methyl ester carboxylesterase